MSDKKNLHEAEIALRNLMEGIPLHIDPRILFDIDCHKVAANGYFYRAWEGVKEGGSAQPYLTDALEHVVRIKEIINDIPELESKPSLWICSGLEKGSPVYLVSQNKLKARESYLKRYNAGIDNDESLTVEKVTVAGNYDAIVSYVTEHFVSSKIWSCIASVSNLDKVEHFMFHVAARSESVANDDAEKLLRNTLSDKKFMLLTDRTHLIAQVDGYQVYANPAEEKISLLLPVEIIDDVSGLN